MSFIFSSTIARFCVLLGGPMQSWKALLPTGKFQPVANLGLTAPTLEGFDGAAHHGRNHVRLSLDTTDACSDSSRIMGDLPGKMIQWEAEANAIAAPRPEGIQMKPALDSRSQRLAWSYRCCRGRDPRRRPRDRRGTGRNRRDRPLHWPNHAQGRNRTLRLRSPGDHRRHRRACDQLGGTGIAIPADHLNPEEVESLPRESDASTDVSTSWLTTSGEPRFSRAVPRIGTPQSGSTTSRRVCGFCASR